MKKPILLLVPPPPTGPPGEPQRIPFHDESKPTVSIKGLVLIARKAPYLIAVCAPTSWLPSPASSSDEWRPSFQSLIQEQQDRGLSHSDVRYRPKKRTTPHDIYGKPTMRSLNNSFVHGAVAYSALALAPYLQSRWSWIFAATFCVYAGWFHKSCLSSFLGGVIVAVAGYAAVATLSLDGDGGLFFMSGVALLLILPTMAAGYGVGKIIFVLSHRVKNNEGA